MSLLHFSSLNTILCLGAHPDDIEIGCGGVLLRIQQENPNAVFHWAVFGCADSQRAAEAANSAARFLPASQARLTPHAFPDARFADHRSRAKDAVHALADIPNLDLVFTHRRDDAHQDHRLLAQLTHQAFRGPTILEYEIPKFDGDLTPPNLYVPLGAEQAAHKAESIIALFPSQADKYWFRAETFLSLARLRGVEARCEFAEAFHASKLIAD